MLEDMATPADPTSPIAAERRPPLCVVAWGKQGMPTVRCVIEQLDLKYTMLGRDGTPLRAVATVRLREATKLGLADGSVKRPRNAKEARDAA
jgi:hypothetical protein